MARPWQAFRLLAYHRPATHDALTPPYQSACPPPLGTKHETWLRRPMSLALIRSSPAVELNPEQMIAVEHGISDPRGPGPLLVVAGAGSGKTAMLAHRVAALILAGADPKRIMLASFSRRAAAELGRRVER